MAHGEECVAQQRIEFYELTFYNPLSDLRVDGRLPGEGGRGRRGPCCCLVRVLGSLRELFGIRVVSPRGAGSR